MSMSTSPYSTITEYLDACCYNPNRDKLFQLLGNNVSMQHTTNSFEAPKRIGKEEVFTAYCKGYFDKVKDLVVTCFKINQLDTPSVRLQIVGEKTETIKQYSEEYTFFITKEVDKRYKFVDETIFIVILEEGVWKIHRIEANVTKEEWQSV